VPTKHVCKACGKELRPGDAIVSCRCDPAHIVHRECATRLLRGKCPTCRGPLNLYSRFLKKEVCNGNRN
jgi:hypothetical protein